MKLNAATELIPVSWPEFGGLHPFVPSDQAGGYQQIVDELSRISLRDHRIYGLFTSTQQWRTG